MMGYKNNWQGNLKPLDPQTKTPWKNWKRLNERLLILIDLARSRNNSKYCDDYYLKPGYVQCSTVRFLDSINFSLKSLKI